MYVLPKGLESAWVMARGKGWVFRTGQHGELIVSGIPTLCLTLLADDIKYVLVDGDWDGYGYGKYALYVI